MAGTSLATYLNNHLAGSVVGLTLLEHIEHANAGAPSERIIADLKAEIADDRKALEGLIARLGIAKSHPRQAAGWLAEKMTELKMKVDDPGGGALHQLESLEALSLGIEGKRLLWRSLHAVAESELAGPDYEELERRAADQRDRVETLRLDAARAAFP